MKVKVLLTKSDFCRNFHRKISRSIIYFECDCHDMSAFLDKATYEEYQGELAKKLTSEWNSACTEFALNDTQQENHNNDELMEDIAADLRKAKAMTVMLLNTDFTILSPVTLHDYFDELDSLISVAESQFECLQ